MNQKTVFRLKCTGINSRGASYSSLEHHYQFHVPTGLPVDMSAVHKELKRQVKALDFVRADIVEVSYPETEALFTWETTEEVASVCDVSISEPVSAYPRLTLFCTLLQPGGINKYQANVGGCTYAFQVNTELDYDVDRVHSNLLEKIHEADLGFNWVEVIYPLDNDGTGRGYVLEVIR